MFSKMMLTVVTILLMELAMADMSVDCCCKSCCQPYCNGNCYGMGSGLTECPSYCTVSAKFPSYTIRGNAYAQPNQYTGYFGYNGCENCVVSWEGVTNWLKDGGAGLILVVAIVSLLLLCCLCCLASAAAGIFGAAKMKLFGEEESCPPAKKI